MINIKGQKFTRCMPSKCKPKPFHHNQGSSPPSLKHPKWIKKKQVVQLCLTPHLVCNIMVKFKVCLFIPCFYVFFEFKNFMYYLMSIVFVYILKKKQKKNFKISKSFPKKREKFSNEKKNFELGALDFLVTFSKNAHFFFFQRFQDGT